MEAVTEDKSNLFLEEADDNKNCNTVQEILKESVIDHVRPRSNSSESSGIFFLGGVSLITDSLLLSSAAAVNDLVLEKLHVTCVINVAAELPDSPVDKEAIHYLKIPVLDSGTSDLGAYFDQVADIVHNISSEGGRTLIHCVAGVSRSASLCIAYLMKHQQMSLLDSYNHVKSRRPSVKPNCGFFKQLIDYEQRLYDSSTVSMVYNEYLNLHIPDVYDAQYRFVNSYRKKNRDLSSRR